MYFNNIPPRDLANSQASSYQPCQPCYQPCQPCYQPCQPCQSYQPAVSNPTPLQASLASSMHTPVSKPTPEKIPSTKKQEYVPYERVVTQMKSVQEIQRVPRQQVTYQVKRKKVTKPVERWVTDYIQVQKTVDYKVQYVPSQKTEYVKMQVNKEEYQYVPVEKQRILYPQEALHQFSKQVLDSQSGQIRPFTLQSKPVVASTADSPMFNIESVGSKKNMDFKSDSKVFLKRISGQQRQKWHLIRCQNGFNIQNIQNGMVLDYQSARAGQPVRLSKLASTPSQIFQFESLLSDKQIHKIRSREGLYLGAGSQLGEEQSVQLQRGEQGSRNQLFRLIKAD